jgi:hypothetical protein
MKSKSEISKGCKVEMVINSSGGKMNKEELKRFKLLQRGYNKGFQEGKQQTLKDVLDFINNQRDNGNLVNEKGFSSSLCLSQLIKMIEKELEVGK